MFYLWLALYFIARNIWYSVVAYLKKYINYNLFIIYYYYYYNYFFTRRSSSFIKKKINYSLSFKFDCKIWFDTIIVNYFKNYNSTYNINDTIYISVHLTHKKSFLLSPMIIIESILSIIIIELLYENFKFHEIFWLDFEETTKIDTIVWAV